MAKCYSPCRRLNRKVQQKTNGTVAKSPRSPLVVNGGNSYNTDKRTSASQESFPPPPPDVDRHSGTLLHDHDYSYISEIPPPPPPGSNVANGGSMMPPPPLSAGHNPPHSPRTASTTVSQSSPGSYQSYKCYMQNLQNQNNNTNYERMPSLLFGDTPPASPTPNNVPTMPKLLAHECALAFRGDKSVMLDKKRHSRGHGSIASDTGSQNHSPRRSKGGTPTYFELEPSKSTAFPFPPPPGFSTFGTSPKNPRSQQSQHQPQQQGIYHVRSPKKVDGKNTL